MKKEPYVLLIVLLLMLAGLQYRLWLGDGGIAQGVQLKMQIAEQKAENERLLERNRVMDAEVMELLPPTPGFFFGTYEIDQWYEHQLDITISQLTAILDSFDFENETLYYYIWY